MSQAVKTINAPQLDLRRPAFFNYLPAILPIVGAFLMLIARRQIGTSFIDDGSLIVMALLCYIIAAAMHLTDLFAPMKGLEKMAVWTASLGFFLNLSSWLVRWINMGDREAWKRLTDHDGIYHASWFFSYIPLANLYDLSVGFAFGPHIQPDSFELAERAKMIQKAWNQIQSPVCRETPATPPRYERHRPPGH